MYIHFTDIKIRRKYDKMEKIHILLIEDSLGDILLTKKMFDKVDKRSEIMVIDNGLKAIEYFKNKDHDSKFIMPYLILLDMNLPGASGLEVLRFIKNHEDLKIIPVIILTTSDRDSEIYNSYVNHANSYISKPFDVLEFEECIKKIHDYWINVSKSTITKNDNF